MDDECTIDIFRPVPVVINDVHNSFFHLAFIVYLFGLFCTVIIALNIILTFFH